VELADVAVPGSEVPDVAPDVSVEASLDAPPACELDAGALVVVGGAVVPAVDEPALQPDSARAPTRTVPVARARILLTLRVIAMPFSREVGQSSPRGGVAVTPRVGRIQ
jgi:hypothetical protein